MTIVLTAKNAAQKIPTIPIFGNVVVQPETWYTCPAGKKAIIKGTCVCSNTGAAAVADLEAAGVSIAEWQATGGVFDPSVPQDLAEGTEYPFEVQLAAGESLITTQDSGSNANFKINAKVQETPI